VKVIWSPLAEARAIEAMDYIAQERPQVAAAWLEELLERTDALERFAKRGRLVQEIGHPAYREILHAPYRVIYRVDPARVIILTLRHWRRAWDPTEVGVGPSKRAWHRSIR
jgi:plasmid stabilization system protein ParE